MRSEFLYARSVRQYTHTHARREKPYPAMFCIETLFESAVVCCDLLLLNIEVTVFSSGASIAERGRSFGCEPGREVSEESQLMQLC